MDTMRSTRLTYAALVASAALALGACSASEPDASPTSEATSTDASPTDEPESSDPADAEATDTEPTDAETTEPSDSEPADGALAGAGDTACLEGSWLYSGEEFEKTFIEMMDQAGGPGIDGVSVEGDSVMTFQGGTLTQEYGPQEVTVDVGAGGMDMSMTMTMSGSTTADYAVADDIITISSIQTDDYQVKSTVLVDGEEMSGLEDLGLDDLMSDVGGSGEGTVRFGCVGDELTLVTIIPEMPDFSFGYTLTRE